MHNYKFTQSHISLSHAFSATGTAPDTWEGTGFVMGNTPRQWTASYNPSRRRRAAQRAVTAHAEARLAAIRGPELLEEPPQTTADAF
jgi:hypothetical protein